MEKDRNTVPASAAPFAGAALLTSAKTTPAHCAMCLKCHQLWQLPSGSRGHHAARQERAGGGRGLPGKAQGRRCFSECRTTSALGAVRGPSVQISITHLPTPLRPRDPHTTAPTPQTSHPLRPTNHTPLCGCRPLRTHAVSRRVLKPWTHKRDTPACVATHRHTRGSRTRKGLCLPTHTHTHTQSRALSRPGDTHSVVPPAGHTPTRDTVTHRYTRWDRAPTRTLPPAKHLHPRTPSQPHAPASHPRTVPRSHPPPYLCGGRQQQQQRRQQPPEQPPTQRRGGAAHVPDIPGPRRAGPGRAALIAAP